MTDSRPTTLAATGAVVAGALATLAVGLAVGVPVATVQGLTAVAALVGGSAILTADPDTNVGRAWGSVGFVGGIVGLAAVLYAIHFPEVVTVGPALIGTAIAGLGGTGGLTAGRGSEIRRVCYRSRDVFGFGTLGAFLGVLVGPLLGAVLWWYAGRAVTGSVLSSLASLGVLVAAAVAITPRARRTLGASDDTVGGVEISGLGSWPLWAYVVVVFLLIVTVRGAVVPPGASESLFTSIPVFGPLLSVLLLTGVLHLLVGAVLVLGVGVLVLEIVHGIAVSWLSAHASRLVARATGGVVVAGAGSVLFVTGGVDGIVTWSITWPELVVGGFCLVLSFFVLPSVLAGAATLLASTDLVAESGAGAVYGALCIAVAGVLVALQGTTPAVVFSILAAAAIVYDLGEYAARLGESVDQSVATTDVETAHVIGSLAVGAVAVVVATAVTALLGGVTLPSSGPQSGLAVTLALVSVLAFLVALNRRSSTA